ncbi:MAG: hypothetical protein AB9888_08225 [Bacteroidales bacterium]
MYSDEWLKEGYSTGDRNIVSTDNSIDYQFWYDKNGQILGVAINFEYAEDSHFEFLYDEFLKLLALLGSGSDLTSSLGQFFLQKKYLYEFSDFLEDNGIQFNQIHFYHLEDES